MLETSWHCLWRGTRSLILIGMYLQLAQDGSMVNVLGLISKGRTLNDKRSKDDRVFLKNIGKIVHLLLGPKYKLLYHEPPFTDESATNEIIKEAQIWHLLLWSILSGKPYLTQFFILRTDAPLGAALISSKLYRVISKYADTLHEVELSSYLSDAADDFEKVAIDILDKMYAINQKEAYRVLISEISFDLGPYVTPLSVADDAKAKKFMQHACCQTHLQKIWKGNMRLETPEWKSYLVLAPPLAILSIHFEDNDHIEHSEREVIGGAQGVQNNSSIKDKKLGVCWKVNSYYTAPVTKFYLRMCFYVAYLFLLSYYVLIDLRPFTGRTYICVGEWFLISWLIGLIADEIFQIVSIRDTGPLHNLDVRELRNDIGVWNYCEKLRMKAHVLVNYLCNGRWNGMDAFMILLFIGSFVLRFSLPTRYFQLIRIAFSVAVIFSYIRLLSYWYILKSVGPSIIAIKMMVTELLKFLLVLVVFIVGFGIAFQAVLHPGQKPFMSLLVNIVWRPYWQMFGELFIDDFEMETYTNATCIESEIHVEGFDIECYPFVAPALLAIYLLIANVLLLNLLIAIFSKKYDEVQNMANTIWLYNLYGLIQESYFASWLPPPLAIFHYLWKILRWCCRKCKTDVNREDKFRQRRLPVEHDLQKQACKRIKQLDFDKKNKSS